MQKERDYSIDFIRALSALGIVLFHFYCHTPEGLPRLFYSFANGSIGNTIVNVFFIVSGYSLYLNNSRITDLKRFYIKRFKAIFPTFYLCFIVAYVYWAIRTHDPFYGGHPVKLLLTVFGVDGYFSYLGPNYYQLGEWFLGAIIILYVIYPLILWIFNRSQLICLAVSAALYATVFIPGIYKIAIEMNLFCCLISFVAGMFLCANCHKWKGNWLPAAVSAVLAAVLLVVKLPAIPNNLCIHILALCLFILMHYLGGYIMNNKAANKVFMELSRLSFPVFLVHHILVSKALQLYGPEDNLHALAFWLFLTIVILIVAKIVYILNDLILDKLLPKLKKA